MDTSELKIIEKIKSIFSHQGLTLSAAESCTGGLISHWITSVPGASMFFRAGLVVYSRQTKEEILAVSGTTMDTCGMISKESAAEMAEKVRLLVKTDYAVASTGNLGPGVLEGKEKGLIYVAACREGKTITKRLNLRGGREKNKEDAAHAALKLLVSLLEKS